MNNNNIMIDVSSHDRVMYILCCIDHIIVTRKAWSPSAARAENRGYRSRPGPWACGPRCRA